jgi:uncharacterized BrkB/YihY/UPF0761 family membrane protein
VLLEAVNDTYIMNMSLNPIVLTIFSVFSVVLKNRTPESVNKFFDSISYWKFLKDLAVIGP